MMNTPPGIFSAAIPEAKTESTMRVSASRGMAVPPGASIFRALSAGAACTALPVNSRAIRKDAVSVHAAGLVIFVIVASPNTHLAEPSSHVAALQV
jgi:hypothetical protein